MKDEPRIALIGTLDTKGDEIAYVRERLVGLGVRPVVIDSGILGEPGTSADVTREEVAREAGHDLERIRSAGSRGAAVELMEEGVRAVCLRLWLEGRLDGVLCLGGAEGALLGAAAMHALPGRRPEADRHAERLGPPRVRPLRGRERRARHALGRRHPRPQPDRACGVRQRGGGRRGHGAGRGAPAPGSGRPERRHHDARPHHAGGDAHPRGARAGRPRAGHLPRERCRRPGDGEARRSGRARRA